MNKVVSTIMSSWNRGELGCVAGDFETFTKDISHGAFNGVGYFIQHIPTGGMQILTWEEDCGYQLWEEDVKRFVEKYSIGYVANVMTQIMESTRNIPHTIDLLKK